MSSDYWAGKAVVITGAGRGQGAAEAVELLRRGATVIAADIHPEDSTHWEQLVADAGTDVDRLHRVIADVSTEAGWDAIVQSLDRAATPLFGLVNNAGIVGEGRATQIAPEEWARVIGVNLTGPYLGTRALGRRVERGGAIVNVSSIAGHHGFFNAGYAASKWGLRGYTRATAVDLAEFGVRVNSVSPGLVDTDMAGPARDLSDPTAPPSFSEANIAVTPLGRAATASELASIVLFLLGPDSSFINATDVIADGGVTGAGTYLHVGREIGLL